MAPEKYEEYELNMTYSDKTNCVSKLTVKVKMVDNLEYDLYGLPENPRATRLTSVKQESLDCKVCLAPFSDHIPSSLPRILPACGHTICHNCAVTIQKMTFNQLAIACPFDRTVTNMKAENLPRNFAILDLIEERGDAAKLTSKVNDIKICEDPVYPCYENEKHESTKYCRKCDADFCDSCFLSVHSSKILSSHQSYSVSHRRFRLPKCSMHSNNIVFHFCNDKECKASTPLCCNTCMQSLHENHTTVPIEEKAEQNERQLLKLLATLSWTEGKKEEALQQAKQNVESLSRSDSEYEEVSTEIKIERDLEKIRETKKEIEDILEKRDTSLLLSQKIVEKGEALCKEATVVPIPMPTIQEIVHSTPKIAKPVRIARQLINYRTWFKPK
ncbi:hypothetical protein CAEBREN_19442 [Caenorhabditis brenneri]|uniref:RING-type domain-containing protein n=1 Tax=Caenorhabditis brenneri TaxID=135651 RepID=G0N3R8_CAEBE|nr:hypothetical protein CAEBREN_19442 [Caenorhabditis brenneri]